MPVFPRGSRFGGDGARWLVTRKLGEGQFAEVYEVRDTQENDVRRAVKIEKKRDMRSVKQESKILKKLQDSNCPLVVEAHESGSYEDRFFLIMELLGPCLADARKDLIAASGAPRGSQGGLPSSVVRPIGLCMLSALEGMHAAGFLHRDVKLANFALYPPSSPVLQGSWKIIDFGLARRFTDDAGAALPPRSDAAFRGSTQYASVHAHRELDLGRRDDLWSWLYCVVELVEGNLPWRSDAAAVMQQRLLVDAAEAVSGAMGGAGHGGQVSGSEQREKVRMMKQLCIEQPSLLSQNPSWQEALSDMSNHLARLQFGDIPDYSFLRSCLLSVTDLSSSGFTQWPATNPQPASVGYQTYAGEYRDTPFSPGEEGGPGQAAMEPHYSATAWAPTSMQIDQPPGGSNHHQLPGGSNQHQLPGGSNQHQLPCHQNPNPIYYPLQAAAAPSSVFYHQNPQGGIFVQPSSAAAAAALGSNGWAGLRGEGSLPKPRISREEKRLEGVVSEAWKAVRQASLQEEEAAAESMGAVASAVKQGLVSIEAKELHGRLGALHPVEALAVMAAVVRDAAEGVDPGAGNVLSHVLNELSLFIRHEAKRCDAKFLKLHQ